MTATVQTKKRRRARNKAKTVFYTLLVIVFIIGAVVGGLIGGVIEARTVKQAVQNNSTALYGTRDGKVLTDDGVLVLTSSDFAPLNCALSEELQEYAYYMCEAYYLDFDFVMALMYVESSFRVDVVSGTNDYGLMQINAINFADLSDKLGVTDFKDGYQNIQAGLYILRGLFEMYDDPAKVLMAYHMGNYGASVLWDKGIYNTTFTNKVLAQADVYAAERAAAKNR